MDKTLGITHIENKMSMKKLQQLKTTYSLKQKFDPFYTGGNVVVSMAETHLLCCCGDKIQIVSLKSGLVDNVIPHEGVAVTAFALSPDDNTVVTASKSLLLKQWVWKDEVKCVRTWKAIHVSSILCMEFDPTSSLLATGGSDGTVKVWDLIGQYCTHNFRGSVGVINVVKFHPNTLTLYSSADDYNIRVWDLKSSKCVSVLESHVSAVTSLHFPSPDKLVSSGRDSVVCIWSVPNEVKETTNQRPNKVIPVFECVNDFAVLSQDDLQSNICKQNMVEEDDFYILTVGSKCRLKVWGNISGKCIFSDALVQGESDVKEIAYTHILKLPQSKQVVAVRNDHCFNVFNLENFEVTKHLVGYNDEILGIKTVGSNEQFMVVVTNSPDIKIFDISSSACQILKGHNDTVLSVDIFSNKMYFASGAKDNTVRLWKLNKTTNLASCLAVGSGHTHAVNCVAACNLSMDFLASGSQDYTMKIWIIKTANKCKTLHVKHTVLGHSKDINSIAISPNDKLVATGSQDKLAKLWSVQEGKHVGTFQGHKRGVWCVQFSPMDQILATSSADGTVKLWGLSDFTCLKTFEGHDCSVLNMIFIVKGTQLITAGSDGLLKLWTVKSSECVQTLDAHNDKIWALCSNSDNDIVISGSADSIISIWNDVTESVREEAIKLDEKEVLNHQELQNLLHEKSYGKALQLAIRLAQPFTALNVVKEILWSGNTQEQLIKQLSKLTSNQKQTLFKFIIAWNTNSRNCHEAQAVLQILLSNTPPDEIANYPDAQSTIEALLPYTERHYVRLSRIAQQSKFLDYTWLVMKMQPQENL